DWQAASSVRWIAGGGGFVRGADRRGHHANDTRAGGSVPWGAQRGCTLPSVGRQRARGASGGLLGFLRSECPARVCSLGGRSDQGRWLRSSNRNCISLCLSRELLDTVSPGKQMLDDKVIG